MFGSHHLPLSFFFFFVEPRGLEGSRCAVLYRRPLEDTRITQTVFDAFRHCHEIQKVLVGKCSENTARI